MITQWSRKDIKEKAKIVLSFNLFKSYVATLILLAYVVVTAVLRCNNINTNSIIAIIFAVVIVPILSVGVKRYFIKTATGEEATFSHIVNVIQEGNFANVAKTMILWKIKIYLWTLLLFIPGIYKSYEYRMVPFILADNPQMPTKNVFELSKEMMEGNKSNVFLFDCSFFGWGLLVVLLSAIVCRLTGVHFTFVVSNIANQNEDINKSSLSILLFYTFLVTYINACYAQLYLLFRKSAIECGIVSEE